MKKVYKIVKVKNKWLIYNTENGMFLRKFSGKGTKKQAQETCDRLNAISMMVKIL